MGEQGVRTFTGGHAADFFGTIKKAGFPAFFNDAQAAGIALALDSLVVFFVQNQVLVVSL